jgi:hypothetical protein
MQQVVRRYDLDWLRVIAFGLLIFYHTGMLYVADWGFHYKSQYQSNLLQYVMLVLNPWRMPLLFFISGVAIRYVLESKALSKTLISRTWRLLLPLLFGVVAIVPIQLFVEMRSAGVIDFGVSHFYKIFFNLNHPVFADYQSGILPHIDVNHLWYLRELWQFSLVLIVCHPVLKMVSIKILLDKVLVNPNIGLLLCTFPLLLACLDFLLFPDSEEGQRIARGFCFLALGYLIHENANWWSSLVINRRLLLSMAIVTSLIFLSYYGLVWLGREEPLNAVGAVIEKLFVYTNRWFSLLAVCAYAATYLNKYHWSLHHWSKAVYPSYIVHQSIIIAACFYLTPYKLGATMEVMVVILATVIGCVCTYFIARNVGFLGELVGVFGLRSGKERIYSRAFRWGAWILVILLGLKILS